jgi:hypothetical protein
MGLVFDIAALTLIAVMGLFVVLYPAKAYDWLEGKTGRDPWGQWSPDRRPAFLWLYRFSGAVGFLGGLLCLVLRIWFSK